MPTPNLPAASLSPQLRLPARQALLRVANHLIRRALWSIGVAILRAELNFLPALREADRRPVPDKCHRKGSGSGHARLSVLFRPLIGREASWTTFSAAWRKSGRRPAPA